MQKRLTLFRLPEPKQVLNSLLYALALVGPLMSCLSNLKCWVMHSSFESATFEIRGTSRLNLLSSTFDASQNLALP
jgi:hypothetical protein